MDRRDFLRIVGAASFVPILNGFEEGQEFRLDDYKYISGHKDFKKVEKYLPLIVDSCNSTRDSFVITPEVAAVNFYIESSFDPYALSWVGAAGLAQFMPYTARDDYGMNVYVDDHFLEALRLSREYSEQSSDVNSRSKTDILKKSTIDDFLVLREKINELDILRRRRNLSYSRYRKNLREAVVGMTKKEIKSFHQPFDEESAISCGVDYMSRMALQCKKRFGMDYYPHIMVYAIASYNAGARTVESNGGIPFIGETVKHVNKFMTKLGQLHTIKND